MRWLGKILGRNGSASAPATAAELRDERLSAYLDGEFAAADAAALERELAADAALRAEFEALRDVRLALRSLGEVRAPRSFALAAPPAAEGRRLIGIQLLTPLATVAAGLALLVVLVAPGGEQMTSKAPETASLSAAPEAAAATRAAPEPAQGAALAAPAASPAAEDASAAAPAAAGADGTASAAAPAAAPPTALTTQAEAAPEVATGSAAADDRRPQAIGLAVLTAVLAVLSFRQWRARRRSAANR